MALFRTTDQPDARRQQLETLKAAVTANLEGFQKAGAALAKIRQEKLYELTHATFAEFVEANWGLTVRRVYQVIAAAEVAETVKHVSHVQPNNRQAEALAGVPKEQQPAAWSAAVDAAPRSPEGEPQLTAAHVEEIAARFKARPKRSRVKKPKHLVLRGKGWKITIERKTLHVDPVASLHDAIHQLEDRQRAAA